MSNNLKILTFLFLGVFSMSTFASEYNFEEKKKELEYIQERIEFVDTVIYYFKEVSEYDKRLFKKYVDLTAYVSLSSENKRGLRSKSKEIYDTTQCLAARMGDAALVYINILNGQLLNNDKLMKQHEKGVEYLVSLDTPDYSPEEIKMMCGLENLEKK